MKQVIEEVNLPAAGSLLISVASILLSPQFLNIIPAKYAGIATLVGVSLQSMTKGIQHSPAAVRRASQAIQAIPEDEIK